MINQDFVPVLDSNSMKVIHIDFPPHRSASTAKTDDGTFSYGLSVSTTAPAPLASGGECPRARIPPPLAPCDFLPDLIAANDPNFKQRDDVKPLHIVQPEGVSFKVKGGEIEWQKWKMHVGAILPPSLLLMDGH